MIRPIILFFALAPGLAAQDIDSRLENDGNVILEGIPEIPVQLIERIDRYQNVRSARFQGWSTDGSFLISTRFGDVSQIHMVSAPGGARRQLTFFSEPTRGATLRPGRTEFTFRMDRGGSEFFQLYLFDIASGDYSLLTDGESRNGAALWSDDGNQLFYQSTLRNGQANDIWVMDPDDPGSARIVLESPDGAWWGPMDADAHNLIALQYISITDSRIHVVDLATGERTLVLGGDDGVGNYGSVTPTLIREGAGFIFASDKHGEFTQLSYFDLASGSTRAISGNLGWNVEGFAISDDGAAAAFSVNQGGLSVLYLMDPATFEYTQVPSIPIGLIGTLEFSPDGKRLAMTLNSPSSPSDVYVLDVNTQALERWTNSEVGGLNTAAFVEPELIAFESFDGREIPAFVYKPADPGGAPFPVIISIHGGPEGQYRPSFSSTFQMWVAELGAAVIAPNVRGSSGYGKTYVALDNGMKREDSVRDIGALLDWIAGQPDLDADKVAVYGGSYGGYMVLASSVHYSDRLAAAVDIVGISNFVTFLENTQDYRRDLRRPEYGDERDPEMRAYLESISPSNHADQIRVPLFVAQGQNDPRVPVTEAEQIVQAVRDNGRDVWYFNALNEGHGFRKKENSDLFRQVSFMFLRRFLTEAPVSARD